MVAKQLKTRGKGPWPRYYMRYPYCNFSEIARSSLKRFIQANKYIMYVGIESHSQWYSMRLWCLHGFDYGRSLIKKTLGLIDQNM